MAVRRGPQRMPPAPARKHQRGPGSTRGGTRRDRRVGRRDRRRRTRGTPHPAALRGPRAQRRRTGPHRAPAPARTRRRRDRLRPRSIQEPRPRTAVPGPRPAGDLPRRAARRPLGTRRLHRPQCPARGLGRAAQRLDAQADQPAHRALPGLRRTQTPRTRPRTAARPGPAPRAPPGAGTRRPRAPAPADLRAQVLKLVSSNPPEAIPHRASSAARTAPFTQHGFPKPLDPPKPRWRTRKSQAAAAAAALVAAAAVLIILALISAGPAHGSRPAALGQATSLGGGTGTPAGPASGTVAPGSQRQPTGPASTGPAGGAAPVSPSPGRGGNPRPANQQRHGHQYG